MTKPLRNVGLSSGLCFMAALASAAPFTSPHGYTITPPPGWTVKPEADASFVFPPGAVAGLAPSVIIKVAVSPPSMTMASLKAKLVPGFKKGPPGTVILSQTSSSLGGVPDLDTIFTATKEGRRFRCRMVYVLKSKFTYVIIAAYPEKTHAQYDAPIARMLASLHWKA